MLQQQTQRLEVGDDAAKCTVISDFRCRVGRQVYCAYQWRQNAFEMAHAACYAATQMRTRTYNDFINILAGQD